MNLSQKTTTLTLADAVLFRVTYSDIARKLGVSRQHVRQVALGITRSKRVEAAIRREMKRRAELIGKKAA